MKKVGETIILGLLLGVAIPFLQGTVMVFANIHDHYASFSFEGIPFMCQIFLAGFQSSLNLYFFASIVGALLLVYLSIQIKFQWVGYIIGFFLGILVNLPYLLLRIQTTGNLLIPMDLIYMGLAVLVFCLAGFFIGTNRDHNLIAPSESHKQYNPAVSSDWQKKEPASPVSEAPNHKRKKLPAVLIIIPIVVLPLLCAACLSAVGLTLFFSQNKNVSNIPDFLWTWRISQNLSEKGFVAQQIFVKRDDASDIFSSLHIVVGISEYKEYLDYRDVMVAVNQEIFSAMESPILLPDGVGDIVVLINDYSIGYRIISVSYDVARDFYLGKKDRYYFIQHWKFLESDDLFPEIQLQESRLKYFYSLGFGSKGISVEDKIVKLYTPLFSPGSKSLDPLLILSFNLIDVVRVCTPSDQLCATTSMI
jgi:hypothetical protein